MIKALKLFNAITMTMCSAKQGGNYTNQNYYNFILKRRVWCDKDLWADYTHSLNKLIILSKQSHLSHEKYNSYCCYL